MHHAPQFLHTASAKLRYARYVPSVDEAVVGFITERYGDAWNLDINGTYAATLPALAFEGMLQAGCCCCCRET